MCSGIFISFKRRKCFLTLDLNSDLANCNLERGSYFLSLLFTEVSYWKVAHAFYTAIALEQLRALLDMVLQKANATKTQTNLL